MSIRQEAAYPSKRMADLQAVLKGYPEFNPDQPRDEGGRFGSGGPAAARAKIPEVERNKARAAYQQRFGYAPPKNMSVAAMRRWTQGEHFATAPGGPRKTPAEYARLRAERAKNDEAYWRNVRGAADIAGEAVGGKPREREQEGLQKEVGKIEAAVKAAEKNPTKEHGDAIDRAVHRLFDVLPGLMTETHDPGAPFWRQLLSLVTRGVFVYGVTAATAIGTGSPIGAMVVGASAAAWLVLEQFERYQAYDRAKREKNTKKRARQSNLFDDDLLAKRRPKWPTLAHGSSF